MDFTVSGQAVHIHYVIEKVACSHEGAWKPGETNRTGWTFSSLPTLFEKLHFQP
jgi:hypothetical protein